MNIDKLTDDSIEAHAQALSDHIDKKILDELKESLYGIKIRPEDHYEVDESSLRAPLEEMSAVKQSLKPKPKIIYIGENRTIEDLCDILKNAMPGAPVVINEDNCLVAGSFGEFILIDSKSKLEGLKVTHLLDDPQMLQPSVSEIDLSPLLASSVKFEDTKTPRNRKERRDTLKIEKNKYTTRGELKRRME